MRTRDYKAFASGEYYHLFNRGNGKMNIFEDDSDYKFFLHRLEEYLYPDRRAPSADRYVRKSLPVGAFSLVCYCLMPNHYHFLIRQNSELPISALMLGLTTGYSKYFNKKYERVGSLFQDQFKAVHVGSNEQLLWLSAYIHQNPKVAGLSRRLEDYEYSSYREYIDSNQRQLCDTNIVLGQLQKEMNYQQYIIDNADKFAEGALL